MVERTMEDTALSCSSLQLFAQQLPYLLTHKNHRYKLTHFNFTRKQFLKKLNFFFIITILKVFYFVQVNQVLYAGIFLLRKRPIGC